jgi:hypothetical protein
MGSDRSWTKKQGIFSQVARIDRAPLAGPIWPRKNIAVTRDEVDRRALTNPRRRASFPPKPERYRVGIGRATAPTCALGIEPQYRGSKPAGCQRRRQGRED